MAKIAELAGQIIDCAVEPFESRADVEREVDLLDGGCEKHLTSVEREDLIRAICERVGVETEIDYRAVSVQLAKTLESVHQAFVSGALAYTKKRRTDKDPYHPSNVQMTEALSLARDIKLIE